jgi:hypothetical protein
MPSFSIHVPFPGVHRNFRNLPLTRSLQNSNCIILHAVFPKAEIVYDIDICFDVCDRFKRIYINFSVLTSGYEPTEIWQHIYFNTFTVKRRISALWPAIGYEISGLYRSEICFPEGEVSRFLWNVCNYPSDHTVSRAGREWSENKSLGSPSHLIQR